MAKKAISRNLNPTKGIKRHQKISTRKMILLLFLNLFWHKQKEYAFAAARRDTFPTYVVTATNIMSLFQFLYTEFSIMYLPFSDRNVTLLKKARIILTADPSLCLQVCHLQTSDCSMLTCSGPVQRQRPLRRFLERAGRPKSFSLPLYQWRPRERTLSPACSTTQTTHSEVGRWLPQSRCESSLG
jgi:hypothetical protein